MPSRRASTIASALHTRWLGARLHHFFRVDSTQTAALEAARNGAAEGELFLAGSQTAGRGRHGHAWASPRGGGLYFSVVLRPLGPPAELLWLTLAAGLAVADGIREATGLDPEIKWPNDLLLDRRKCAGLLLEMSAEATRIHHAVMGVGINVHRSALPPELAPLATSLGEHVRARPSRLQVLAAVLRHLERRYESFQHDRDCAAIGHEFERRSRYARGLRVRIGEGAMQGVTAGLDPSGFLRVRRDDGHEQIVTHGGVRALDEPPTEAA